MDNRRINISEPKTSKVSTSIHFDRENNVLEIGDVKIELSGCWVASLSVDGDKTKITIKPAL